MIDSSGNNIIFDNEDILLELDGSNNITARYTHGPGIDESIIMEKGGASFFYHADGLGSITEITDAMGALKQQYTYSSFGKIEFQLDPVSYNRIPLLEGSLTQKPTSITTERDSTIGGQDALRPKTLLGSMGEKISTFM